ncbi:MAG: hypothetical protein A2089_10985 [Elusimicrobia bacterium GWD2_63_28]|nr:MAG: hypothetical protein A2089_10985 [Elusimicrobia bacterium GWD2_63_28]
MKFDGFTVFREYPAEHGQYLPVVIDHKYAIAAVRERLWHRDLELVKEVQKFLPVYTPVPSRRFMRFKFTISDPAYHCSVSYAANLSRL